MSSPIQRIVRFNHDAGLAEKGYDDFLESSFQVEEALEGFDLKPLARILQLNEHATPKELSRYIVSAAIGSTSSVSDVDRLDKACDAVVFAVGSMAKLGLDAFQIEQALNTVMRANEAKLNCPKDEHGKLCKPDDFDKKYAPEPKLKALLESTEAKP